MDKYLLVFIIGLAWMYGKSQDWEEETTGYIGWAFWLIMLLF